MINLEIKYTNSAQKRILTYDPKICSFDIEPVVVKWDYELIVNKLGLSVIDTKIIQLWGVCGYVEWNVSDCLVPCSEKGELRVITKLNHGFCYGINDNDAPVFVNKQSGWICIGDPSIRKYAVEFIDNCIAVIKEHELVALWLKPQTLPPL